MEVMGLMLGEFVDDFTVRVVDVFAMPQSGTGVSVEAVDPVFQMKMMDMLRQTGRYGSVPGLWGHLLSLLANQRFTFKDRSLLSAGTTPIPDSDVGCHPSIFKPSSHSNNLPLVPSPSSSILSSRLRGKSSSMLSA